MPENANIAARLQVMAATRSDQVAIVERRGRHRSAITFAGLAQRVAALSAGLVERGARPGDRVVLFVPMSIDLYVALLAVVHAGASAVFVDAWAGRGRLDDAIGLAAPRGFIGTPRSLLLRLMSRRVADIPIVLVAGRRWLPLSRYERAGAVRDPAAVDASTPAVVTFTTGSTGNPRGVPRTHGMLWAQHLALAEHLGLRQSDVDMPTLPIFVLNNLACGIRSVIPDFDPRRPADIVPSRILEQMKHEGVTTASGSPAFFARLAAWCEAAGEMIPLRSAFTGGAPVLPSLARQLQRSMAPGAAHVVFGATEVEPVAGIAMTELVHLLDAPTPGATGLCVGRPVSQLQLCLVRPTDGEIAGEAFGSLVVRDGEVGEIAVSGDHVLPGYLHDEDANRRTSVFAEGRRWFRTGDCAWRDSEGRLWLVGRLSQRVRRRGEVLWPLPIELQALALSFVTHATLLGVDDPALGQRAVLCVESPNALSAEQEQAVRAAVSPSPIDQVIGLREIPRDPRHQSKADLTALRRRIALA